MLLLRGLHALRHKASADYAFELGRLWGQAGGHLGAVAAYRGGAAVLTLCDLRSRTNLLKDLNGKHFT